MDFTNSLSLVVRMIPFVCGFQLKEMCRESLVVSYRYNTNDNWSFLHGIGDNFRLIMEGRRHCVRAMVRG